MINFTVPDEFIVQRNERKEKYNARGRDDKKHLMDIDCELFEYYHLEEVPGYSDDDRWEIDMVKGHKNIDCKCITKWYNISQMKMCYLLRQHGATTHFQFWEWTERPDRPLEAGDEVVMQDLGTIKYWDVLKNIQPSGYNGGYYVNVRKLLNV